jgi:hypothetical protein
VASIYGNHGAGSNSIYRSGGGVTHYHGGTGPVRTGRRKKKRGGGFLHALGSAVHNTGHAIAGIGPGVYESGKALGSDVYHEVRHPTHAAEYSPFSPHSSKSQFKKKVVVPTAKGYAHKYGPLVHADFGEFAHRALVEDPLGTILDAATVATVGAGAAAKAGVIAKAPRSVVVRSPGAIAGQEGAKTIERGIHGSQLSRSLRVQANKIAQRHPHLRVIGEVAQYGRAMKAHERSVVAGRTLKAKPHAEAMAHLPREQRIAAELLQEYPTTKILNEHKAQLAAKVEQGDQIAAKQLKLLNNKKVNRYHAHPTEKMLAANAKAAELGDISAGLSGLDEATALNRRFQPALMARGAKKGDEGLIAPEGTTIPEMMDQLRSELKAEGRSEPIYRPHESIASQKGTKVGAGGLSPSPLKPGSMRENRGVLASMGRVAYNADTLTPAYMRVVRFATYKDRFGDLLASGVKLPKDAPLPEGYQYLRRSAGEKIPFTEASAGEFERNLDDLLGKQGGKIRDLLGTNSATEAHITEDGYRIIVPTKMVKQITGEFERSNNVISKFFNKSTQVWRALVLNLRVGWLVNNLVGNTLLYTVKTAGAGGLRAYLRSMADIHGADWVRNNLVLDPKVAKRITAADMAELLPEQVSGTFFGTQYQAGKFSTTRVGKAVTAPPKAMRHADIGYEQALRRALANQILRRSPEVRARLQAMPKETKSWREAAKQELGSNRVLADRVSREINDSLGQFDNMTPLEQKYLRSVAPFYGWFRAITIVMAKMPLDNPLRSNILLNLGKLGEQYQAEGYPYGGAIDLGGGKILKTAGLNPYVTPVQLAPSLSTIAQAELGHIPGTHTKSPTADEVGYALSGFANPAFSAPFGGGVAGVAHNLPETQILFPRVPKHKNKALYSDYNRRAALLQYLGVPIRHLRQP